MNLPKTLRRPSGAAAAAWFLFFLSLLPILYLGLHNHATAYTHIEGWWRAA